MTDAIAAIIAIIAAIGGAFFYGTRKGRNAEQITQKQRQAKADAKAKAKAKAKEARDEVDRLSDDAVLDRLRRRSGK